MARYFTLREARQHLAALGGAIREAIEAKKTLETAERERRARHEKIIATGGMAVDHEAAMRTRDMRDASTAKLKQVFAQFEEIGCLIKDLDIGLIDFPALYQGKEVYLCWRLGEDDIAFWHPTDEGFGGRRPIDKDFLAECG